MSKLEESVELHSQLHATLFAEGISPTLASQLWRECQVPIPRWHIVWKLELWIFGPDMRYNGAKAVVQSWDYDAFVAAIKLGLTKLEALTKQAVSGTYTANVARVSSVSVALTADSAGAQLTLGIDSPSGYRFRVGFTLPELKSVLVTLEGLPTRGQSLCESLHGLR